MGYFYTGILWTFLPLASVLEANVFEDVAKFVDCNGNGRLALMDFTSKEDQLPFKLWETLIKRENRLSSLWRTNSSEFR